VAVLPTGFEGYGRRSLNPAEEVAKALAGTGVAGETVAGRLLPVAQAGHRRRGGGGAAARRPVSGSFAPVMPARTRNSR
jgi:hypothetical protein